MTSRRRFLQLTGASAAAAAAASLPATDAAAGTPGTGQAGPTGLSGPNAAALAAILAAAPRWVDCRPLGELRPELSEAHGRFVTHAGPPVDWAHMSGPQRGNTIAVILAEGWADTPEAAARLAARGGITLTPNHEHAGTGSMAGGAGPHTMVYVTEDRGRIGWSWQEWDRAYGNYGPMALAEARLWDTVIMPALGRAIRHLDGLDLKPIDAQAIGQLGDDGHCIQDGYTLLVWSAISQAVADTSSPAVAEQVRQVVTAPPRLLGLGLGMAQGKATMRCVEGIKGSTVITRLARNGTEVGFSFSAQPDRWWTGPALPIDFVYASPDFTPPAAHDMGDSMIRETYGEGACTGEASAILLPQIGLTEAQARRLRLRLAGICVGTHTDLPIAALGGAGPPCGFEVHRVVGKRFTPHAYTAVAPRHPSGVDPTGPFLSFVGLGVAHFPLKPFLDAAHALEATR
jgi:hypothetical protein